MTTATITKTVLVSRLAARTIVVNPRRAVLHARMALWVVAISLLARLTALTRVQKIAAFRVRSNKVESPSLEDCFDTMAQLGRAIDCVLGIDLFVFRRSCWKRAMVLHRFLALNGIESHINFGLQKGNVGNVSGHAWLEHEGRPLLEDDAASYTLTFSLPRQHTAPCCRARTQPDHQGQRQ
jgi:Transglutaminase-like superfamily